ncbi:hypothetical protein SELMODRAFT_441577 [Selaginella moellendorffii]|uniref:peptidylprolyl isomerase n=2 Tax=Selaginella moellendorffii TaxID=88036 RepID=D8RKS7_SELML|nr:hypothetical protein SELMODRAFT_441577 [Selaginella moellendorffii]
MVALSFLPSGATILPPSPLPRRNFLALGCPLLVAIGSAGNAAQAVIKSKAAAQEEKLLESNQRIQQMNGVPPDFPSFVRQGFKVKVVASPKYVTTSTGLIYLDLEQGSGDCPSDGQQVIFNYIGYNEAGRRIDSSYQKGQPSKTRLGDGGLVPGFEEGIKSMRPGGKRRIVVPPELGPPVGPSTFFSSKQFEIFDVELVQVKDCVRKTVGFFSALSCD